MAARRQSSLSRSGPLQEGRSQGCGLPGLLAAKLGASEVLLTDKDPAVLEALRLSVAANGLGDVCSVEELVYGAAAPASHLVLAADALYLTCQVDLLSLIHI